MTTNIDKLLSFHPFLNGGKSRKSAVVTRLRNLCADAELTDLRNLFGVIEAPEGEPLRPSEVLLRELAGFPGSGMQSASWMVLFDVLASMVCGYADVIDDELGDVQPAGLTNWGVQLKVPAGIKVRTRVSQGTVFISFERGSELPSGSAHDSFMADAARKILEDEINAGKPS